MDATFTDRDFTGQSLLLVEDDPALLEVLAHTLTVRGFNLTATPTVQSAIDAIDRAAHSFAVIDLSLPDGSGLEVTRALKDRTPDARFLMMSGYGDISNAVSAVKVGAADYLIKPLAVDDIVTVLTPDGETHPAERSLPMSPQRVRWEHIQSVMHDCRRNVSETARRLQMHRRTLQRILAQGRPR